MITISKYDEWNRIHKIKWEAEMAAAQAKLVRNINLISHDFFRNIIKRLGKKNSKKKSNLRACNSNDFKRA